MPSQRQSMGGLSRAQEVTATWDQYGGLRTWMESNLGGMRCSVNEPERNAAVAGTSSAVMLAKAVGSVSTLRRCSIRS